MNFLKIINEKSVSLSKKNISGGTNFQIFFPRYQPLVPCMNRSAQKNLWIPDCMSNIYDEAFIKK